MEIQADGCAVILSEILRFAGKEQENSSQLTISVDEGLGFGGFVLQTGFLDV